MISFERIPIEEFPWSELGKYESANIFHTRNWIEFLADYYNLEPVVAAVKSNDQRVGFFTGLMTKKYGLRILGSPFRGWNTFFMGFVLNPEVSYHDILQVFPEFVFNQLQCDFFMIVDLNIQEDDLKGLPYHVREVHNYELDLTKSEEELLASMENKYVRRAIRRAIKKGVVIEEANDPEFADEYYAQYLEVMKRQSLSPLYGLDFVRQMISRFRSSGNLLLLRARNTEGKCVATIIDFVYNKAAVGWGAASWKQYQHLNPNELMIWYEMKKVKEMEAEVLNLGDMKKQFKQKFGAQRVPCFRIMKGRNPFVFYYAYAAVSLEERLKRHA